jgi:hypothetical protein
MRREIKRAWRAYTSVINATDQKTLQKARRSVPHPSDNNEVISEDLFS